MEQKKKMVSIPVVLINLNVTPPEYNVVYPTASSYKVEAVQLQIKSGRKVFVKTVNLVQCPGAADSIDEELKVLKGMM
jgi:hypothetical protein